MVATVPIVVVPSLNTTLPVGETPATEAVKVRLVPTTTVVTLVVKVVVVAAWALRLNIRLKLSNNKATLARVKLTMEKQSEWRLNIK